MQNSISAAPMAGRIFRELTAFTALNAKTKTTIHAA
jgi:hypothetical protein